ncbi:uncharacterized protein BO97DRAFT_409195 [Aspergillus homomorphus CBS 101889]|uniref:Synaptobrevin n=1 Tax=Aspergillus homomorphus (strain CBS 101889) TaxID=1450537 RepID=A0A395HLM3_ASPHC|nr:hypothetical protein BO97DRAFT_409195 [Aspergillus homomorphus CBS 101889]RAL07174.1 hypothetical protein BO97DRAFT_409195 [Aspergillus homomorphus CBS 101889]
MTLTTYDTSDSSNLAALNLSRLLARLEYNLLSSAADLRPLRRSDHQRKRVGANIDYARTTLQNLERTLPQIKPLDRRQSLQSDLAQQRLVLNRLQDVLDQLTAEAETSRRRKQHQPVAFSNSPAAHDEATEDDSDSDSDPLDGDDLLGTPDEGSTTDEVADEDTRDAVPDDLNDDNTAITSQDDEQHQPQPQSPQPSLPSTSTPSATQHTPTTKEKDSDSPLPTTAATATTQPPLPPQPQSTTTVPQTTSTLRNRSNAAPTSTTAKPLTATGSSLHHHHAPQHPSTSTSFTTPPTNPHSTEEALVSDRAEQEDLTSSLLSLASQLKSSSQAFHASLDAEKSVLARAADGLDRTTGNMEAAERRMGMLRRMTEGKGWWGRMMLYAWIFGLWIVAILIVFVGPKLRF